MYIGLKSKWWRFICGGLIGFYPNVVMLSSSCGWNLLPNVQTLSKRIMYSGILMVKVLWFWLKRKQQNLLFYGTVRVHEQIWYWKEWRNILLWLIKLEWLGLKLLYSRWGTPFFRKMIKPSFGYFILSHRERTMSFNQFGISHCTVFLREVSIMLLSFTKYHNCFVSFRIQEFSFLFYKKGVLHTNSLYSFSSRHFTLSHF